MVIATKFGYLVDEANKAVTFYGSSDEESDVSGHLRADVEDSLRRLETDYIDVYQLHVWGLAVEEAFRVREILEALVVRARSAPMAGVRPHRCRGRICHFVQRHRRPTAVQRAGRQQRICWTWPGTQPASIIRGPLGMGSLTGKFTPATTFAEDDVRAHAACTPASKTGPPTQNGWTPWRRSGAYSPAAAAPSPRARWLGCGQTAKDHPIPGFRPLPRWKTTAGQCIGPPPPTRWQRSTRFWDEDSV